MDIRDITISFSKNKAKLLRKREQEIQNRLEIPRQLYLLRCAYRLYRRKREGIC